MSPAHAVPSFSAGAAFREPLARSSRTAVARRARPGASKLGAAQLDTPPPVIIFDKCKLELFIKCNNLITKYTQTELIYRNLNLLNVLHLISDGGVPLCGPYKSQFQSQESGRSGWSFLALLLSTRSGCDYFWRRRPWSIHRDPNSCYLNWVFFR